LNTIFQARILDKFKPNNGENISDSTLSEAYKKYETGLRVLDKTLVKRLFVAGDHLTIADIVLAEYFSYESFLEFSTFIRSANIRRWYSLVKKKLGKCSLEIFLILCKYFGSTSIIQFNDLQAFGKE
jgi:glutathione S-transferase